MYTEHKTHTIFKGEIKMEEEKIYDVRGKKGGFKKRKENTVKSLKEVECFLWNLKQVFKGVGAYKILKK